MRIRCYISLRKSSMFVVCVVSVRRQRNQCMGCRHNHAQTHQNMQTHRRHGMQTKNNEDQITCRHADRQTSANMHARSHTLTRRRCSPAEALRVASRLVKLRVLVGITRPPRRRKACVWRVTRCGPLRGIRITHRQTHWEPFLVRSHPARLTKCHTPTGQPTVVLYRKPPCP